MFISQGLQRDVKHVTESDGGRGCVRAHRRYYVMFGTRRSPVVQPLGALGQNRSYVLLHDAGCWSVRSREVRTGSKI